MDFLPYTSPHSARTLVLERSISRTNDTPTRTPTDAANDIVMCPVVSDERQRGVEIQNEQDSSPLAEAPKSPGYATHQHGPSARCGFNKVTPLL
mmetsp:Transcript_38954/g.63408  ORF Transcript_38954/g.63408 Transcript_38954/m.63408 type:complete len:94 (-) Transcript_38954:1538-1819(-)